MTARIVTVGDDIAASTPTQPSGTGGDLTSVDADSPTTVHGACRPPYDRPRVVADPEVTWRAVDVSPYGTPHTDQPAETIE